jgi:NodT family efflux transporter outer membrane factor (OMF) lipoprotein
MLTGIAHAIRLLLSWRAAALLAAISTAMLGAGCAVGPDYKQPEPPQADGYTAQPLPGATAAVADLPGGAAQVFAPGTPVPARWWTAYGCPALDALVEEAFKANPTVQSAQAALREAHENVLAAWGLLLPAADATASAERLRLSGAQFGPSSPSFVYNLYNASVNISYALDLWGGARRELESLRAQRDYEGYVLEGTYLTLASNVVTTAIAEASLRAQIDATEHLVQASARRLEVVKTQLRLGGASSADVLAEAAQLAQDRATLPGLRDQLEKQRSLLATLLGRVPSDQPPVQFQLGDLHLPESLPLSLPSDLVNQRPDVRQQEELLHEASAQVGVATANMLPQISLTAAVGGSSTLPESLFQAANRTWSVGAGVSQPLFHGGKLLHQRRAAVAAYEQALADYRAAVLTAFRNVADTLRALSDDADALSAQSDAATTAAASLALTDRQYSLGAVSFLTLLNAQRAENQAHILLIQAQAARYADTAALFQALGGGWHGADARTSANAAPSSGANALRTAVLLP